MNPLLKQFVEETREFLEDAAGGLLALEKNPEDTDAMGRVFRAMHSTKGGSGLFDFDAMTGLVHEAENLLDEIRNGERPLQGALVDQLLEVLDQVGSWVDAIERDEALPDDAPERSRALVAKLHEAAGTGGADGASGETAPDPQADPGAEAPSAPAAAPPAPGWQPEWLEQIPDDTRRALVRAAWIDGADVVGFAYAPDSGTFFSGGDPLLLVRDVEGLEWLDIAPGDPWPALAELDPYECRLRFLGAARGPLDAVADAFAFEDEETLHCDHLDVDALAHPVGEPGDPALLEEFQESAPAALAEGDAERLRQSARAMASMVGPELREASALAWLELALEAGRWDVVRRLLETLGCDLSGVADAPAAEPAAAAPAPAPETAAPTAPAGAGFPEAEAAARTLLNEQLAVLAAGDPEGADRAGRVDAVGRVIRRALGLLGADTGGLDADLQAAAGGDLEPLRRRLQGDGSTEHRDGGGGPAAPAPAGGDAETAGGGERVAKSFRVDAESVDLLGDLVGELVVAKNSFPFLAQRAEHEYGVRELARELKDRFNVISRIAQDMQSAVMQVQMLPMAQIFQRFPRLVRDLSRRLDKEVELVREGEQTEADKTVIEVLGEPLTHMVRNSIDHGIEAPAEREAAGKPRCGTLRLSARQEGDSVVIEVSDDGKGLDPEGIRAKAVEKGLVEADEAGRMNDADALQLIFAAGFSTRDAVSDLSGRGVGMDVVRSTVNRYGGSVSVDSEKGQGTRLRLSMPLTMAVSYVMGVEVAGQLFGVPMETVVETVRLPQSAVRRVKREEAVVLREQVIPLRRLDRLLSLDPDATQTRSRVDANYDEPQITVLVVRQPDGPVGLVVDDFQEGMDVIVKPLEGVLSSIRAYSGTALLGDGRVLLVLNLRELL